MHPVSCHGRSALFRNILRVSSDVPKKRRSKISMFRCFALMLTPQEMERNKAAAKQSQVKPTAQLLITFPPFPAGHPAHEHSICCRRVRACCIAIAWSPSSRVIRDIYWFFHDLTLSFLPRVFSFKIFFKQVSFSAASGCGSRLFLCFA